MEHLLYISISGNKTISSSNPNVGEAISDMNKIIEDKLKADGYENVEVSVSNISADAFVEQLQEEGWVFTLDESGKGTAILPSPKNTSLLTIDNDKLSLQSVDNKERRVVFHQSEEIDPTKGPFAAWGALTRKWCDATLGR